MRGAVRLPRRSRQAFLRRECNHRRPRGRSLWMVPRRRQRRRRMVPRMFFLIYFYSLFKNHTVQLCRKSTTPCPCSRSRCPSCAADDGPSASTELRRTASAAAASAVVPALAGSQTLNGIKRNATACRNDRRTATASVQGRTDQIRLSINFLNTFFFLVFLIGWKVRSGF